MTFKVKSGINVGNLNIIDANPRYQLTDSQPATEPTLNLDFINTPYLDTRVTIARTSNGTFYNRGGFLTETAANTARFGYNPITHAPQGLLIEGASTNLMPSSEQPHNTTNWSTAGTMIIEPNVEVSPRGDYSATKLILGNGVAWNGAAHGQNVTKPAVSNTYTFSVYVKSAEYTATRIMIRDNADINNIASAQYNIANNTFYGTFVGGTFTSPVTTSEDVGNGWYRIAITCVTSTETSLRAQIYSYDVGAGNGNGISGIYIWGAQLEVSSIPTSYVPTTETFTSRSSLASYQDSTDNLIKYAGVNLLTYSNVFTDASWVKGGVTTFTANADVAPDGTNNAWRLTMPVGSGTFASHGFSAVSGTTYTFSVYIRSTSVVPTLSIMFESSAGTASPLGSAVNITATSSWVRYSVTYTAVTTGTLFACFENQLNTVATDVSIWGAQVEVGSTPTLYAYTTNVTSAAVRPQYNPSTRVNQRSLLENAGTNLVPYSTIGTGWTYSGDTVINNAVAPDGTTTAATVTVPAAVTLTSPYIGLITVSSSTVYTFSVYVKRGTLSTADYKIAVYDETNSAFIATDIVPLPNNVNSLQWTRISYTFTTPATCTQLRVYPYRASSTGSGGTVFLWGAQVEQARRASSYIPTNGSTVTRSADVYTSATITRAADIVSLGTSGWFNNQQGTFVADFNIGATTGQPFIVKGDAEYVTARSTTIVGTWNGTSQVDASSATANTLSSASFAVAYSNSANFRAMSLNGDAVGYGSGTLAGSTTIYLGSEGTGARSMRGFFRRLMYYPTAASNTQVQALTRN